MVDFPDYDPRYDLDKVVDWLSDLIAHVRPDQWDRPTPNQDWTVRQLVEHVIAVLDEGITTFGQESTGLVAREADNGQLSDIFNQTVEALHLATADPTVLTQEVTSFAGQTKGAVFLSFYLPECLVHGWDLAVATGQHSEGPSDVAARALISARKQIPADNRDPQVFGPVVEVSPGVGETRLLAAWLGRPDWPPAA
jgi:uncharacterized protein (TIGR03086 family)